MEYKKSFLSFNEQADLLISRGLLADKEILINRLSSVNYYRLSAYMYPFRLDDDMFKPNTTLDLIWSNYCFDRKLRILILDAIERVEVSIKTDIAYYLSKETSPFSFFEYESFPNFYKNKNDNERKEEYKKLLEKINQEVKHSREEFVKHYIEKYDKKFIKLLESDIYVLPNWMTVELLSFGVVKTLFKGLPNNIKKSIAKKYNVSSSILESWLQTIQIVRNICAHHGRIYNRNLSYIPKIPKNWKDINNIPNNKIFCILTILNYLLNIIDSESTWSRKLVNLLKENLDIPLNVMGFNDDWYNLSIWYNVKQYY